MLEEAGLLRGGMIITGFLFALGGCAATRYIANPSPPPSDLGLRAASEGLEVNLHYVIAPNGPGAWVQGAKWNEWVLSIRNLSQADLRIGGISLIDPQGVYVGRQYVSVRQLESASETMERLHRQGLGRGAVEGAALSTASRATAATGSAIPIVGFGHLSGLTTQATMYMEVKDREAIEAEFAKRRLPFPLRLSGGGSIRGSTFFPLILEPQAIVITYSTEQGGGEKQIRIPLEKISTLSPVTSPKPQP